MRPELVNKGLQCFRYLLKMRIMEKWLRIFLCFSCLLLSGYFFAQAQQIENLSSDLNGDIIEVTFDLIDVKGGQTFDLQLFSSHNNFSSPLLNVSGDVGEEVISGKGKRIVWEAKKELGEYKGEIYLEVRGIVTPPFVRVLSPKEGDKFKPGKEIDISWDTSISGDKMNIDLFRDGGKVSTMERSISNGKFELDKDIAKGGGYYLVFSHPSKPGRKVESQQFVVCLKS